MNEIKIDNELRDLIPPLSKEEFNQLESNIVKEGWRDNEAILLWNGYIVDGHNRHNVCSKNNIEFKTRNLEFKDKNEVILWMIDNQLGRRNLPDFARGTLNLKKEEILRPIAQENKSKLIAESNKNRNKENSIVDQLVNSEDTDKPKKINVREQIAKMSNVGEGTLMRIKYINQKADDETKKKLMAGDADLSISKVYNNLKSEEKKAKVLEEAQQAKEIPRLEDIPKKYKIILADPPWKYFESGHKNQSNHYLNMDMEDIKNLKVSELADDDCILFLWVTFPILKEAFDVIDSWGFKYSTCGFNWVKKNKNSDSWFFGLGSWTRANSELCLIATKGKPIRFSASVSQVIDCPIEQHSKKPDIVRDKIVELCGDLPRIELFARQKENGWDVWGNQADE